MNTGETIALIKALGKGGGGSSLPSVTSSDNGKVLAVEDGAWAASEQGKKFIVTLTPTALDYSGTMDKTVAEINAAYEAGMEIWFDIVAPGGHVELKCTQAGYDGAEFPSFNAYLIMDTNNALILAYTETTNDGTKQTYGTKVYALTPAS